MDHLPVKWSEEELKDFVRLSAAQTSLETAVGAKHCVSCHGLNSFLFADTELEKRMACLLSPHVQEEGAESWTKTAELCNANADQSPNWIWSKFPAESLLSQKKLMRSGTFAREFLSVDQFNLRQFGYYLTEPTISAVKQIRSHAHVEQTRKLMESLLNTEIDR